jgi:TP901 family phage tail tape measure protein
MADSIFIPPIVAEIIAQTTGFSEGVAKTKLEMAGLADGVGVSGAAAGTAAKDAESDIESTASKSSSVWKDTIRGFEGLLGTMGVPIGALRSSTRDATHAVDGLGTSIGGASAEGEAAGGVGGGFLIAGVAVAALAGIATKLGINMQDAEVAISKAGDVSTATAGKIGDAFLSTGGSVEFSGTTIANAFAGVAGQLKAAGIDISNTGQDLLIMKASSDLASASGLDLNDTTTALAGVMQAYHLNANQAASATDTLYNVSRITNIPITTLATTMDKLKSRLGDLAPSLQDVGTLMSFPAVASQGSRGALLVNTALTTLLGGSKATSAELDSLHVKLFNASGQFIGMKNAIGLLEPKLASMTEQQRMAAEKTLFGSSAAQIMNSVLSGGVSAYEKTSEEANKVGSAHAAAAKQAATLGGQWHIFTAELVDEGTKIGTALIPILTEFAKVALPGVTWAIEAIIDVFKVVGTALGQMAYSFYQMYESVSGAVGSVKDFVIGAFQDIVNFFETVWKKVVGVIEAPFIAVVNAFTDFKSNMLSIANSIVQGISQAFLAVGTAITNVFNGIITTIGAVGTDVVNAIGAIPGEIEGIMGTFVTAGENIVISIVSGLGDVGTTIWNGISGGLTTVTDDLIGWVNNLPGAVTNAVSDALSSIGGMFGGLWGQIKSAIGNITSGISNFFDSLWSGISSAVSTPINDIVGAFGSIGSFITKAWSGLGSVLGTALKAVINALISVINDAIKGINIAIGAYDDTIGAVGHLLGIGGKIGKIGEIPHLAEGGVATSPTLAVVGDAGPEAIVPLSQYQQGGKGGLSVENINVYGNNIDANQMVTQLYQKLRPMLGQSN